MTWDPALEDEDMLNLMHAGGYDIREVRGEYHLLVSPDNLQYVLPMGDWHTRGRNVIPRAFDLFLTLQSAPKRVSPNLTKDSS